MNGTNFFLVVNFFVAQSFCVVFLIVSSRSRSAGAARWIAAAFCVASFSTVAELLVAHTSLLKPSAVLAFASMLAGLLLLNVGISRLYARSVHACMLVAVFCGGVVLDLVIYGLPRGTPLHAYLYQAPFALALFLSFLAVVASRPRSAIDRTLAILLLAAALHFPLKAWLSVRFGGGPSAADYIHSSYSLMSQSATGVFVVLTGLMLLAVFVLDLMGEERSNSERDVLSSLLNRRGFDNQAALAMKKSATGSHAVIICDLDHFKSINDGFGHRAGDTVIRAFANLLSDRAPAGAIVARVGGEEFAVLLSDAHAPEALSFAHTLREAMSTMAISGLPASFRTTASFGVSGVRGSQDLYDALERADKALYEAKRSGRNSVRYHAA